MARLHKHIIESLVRRIQQEGGFAVSYDFATSIYTLCAQVINIKTRKVIATDTFNTKKEKLIYAFREVLTTAIDIIEIRVSGRRIEKVDKLYHLSNYDIDWPRKIDGTRFEFWHQMGRDLLILYPGKATASTVEVTYVKLLTHYTDFEGASLIESQLPDEETEQAEALAEIVLLARFRQLAQAKLKLEDYKTRYKRA